MQIINKAAALTTKLMSNIKVNSPIILVCTGTLCFGASLYFAHRAGRHVDEVIDVNKALIDNVKEMREAGSCTDSEGNVEEFTENDYRKELAHNYISAAWDMTKLYGPVVLFAGAGIASYLGGHKILAQRLAGMTVAYTTVQEAYKRYRQNVIEIDGEEADRKYYLGLNGKATEEYYDTKVVDGKEVNIGKAKTREFDVVEDIEHWSQASEYAVRIDMIPNMPKDFNYQKIFLEGIERNANNTLDVRGRLTLYEVYDALGILYYLTPEIEMMSHMVGWVKGKGDGDVRFKLVMVPTKCAIKNGEVQPLLEVGLLDFNCVGTIWDKVCTKKINKEA